MFSSLVLSSLSSLSPLPFSLVLPYYPYAEHTNQALRCIYLHKVYGMMFLIVLLHLQVHQQVHRGGGYQARIIQGHLVLPLQDRAPLLVHPSLFVLFLTFAQDPVLVKLQVVYEVCDQLL